MRQRFRHGGVGVAAAVLLSLAACSTTAETSQPEGAQASQDPTTTSTITTSTTSAAAETSTTSPAPVTTTSTSLDPPIDDSSAVLAAEFLAARADRDLDLALTYLDRNVTFEWGPGGTYDTLESVWAWEDAFTVVHSTQDCETVGSSGDTTTVLCRLKVDSEVAEAAGNSTGLVCATMTVVDQRITDLGVDVDTDQGCEYRYWGKMFAPFGHWLGTAHPDITIEEMYDDRISETGLDLWTRYTQEFLADHG